MGRLINKRELKRRVERQGVRKVVRHLSEAIADKHINIGDVSIRDLAECLIVGKGDKQPVGQEWVEQLGPTKRGGFLLMEAATGVSLSGFNNITGNLIYRAVMEGYQQEEFIASQLVTEYQTNTNGEKIPGITGITEAVEEVAEGMKYPEVGFGEDWIETPKTTKRGFIISVNKETIFFDRTSQVAARAGQVGEVLSRKKEKMVLDGVLGITNTYKWRGTSYNTYQTATPWINKLSGVTIADWQQVDAAEQLFADMLEPNTGEPIVITPKQILHMPAKRHLWRQITRATTLVQKTDSANQERYGANSVDPYQLLSSSFAYRRLIASGVSAANAKLTWLIGDFKKAFAWQYNWPITVVQAPPNSTPEFEQDIVLRWKASERGSFVVLNPRYAAYIYNA